MTTKELGVIKVGKVGGNALSVVVLLGTGRGGTVGSARGGVGGQRCGTIEGFVRRL